MARVLITGATGFIGGHVAALHRREGHRVRCTVRAGSDLRSLRRLGVELVRADLRHDDLRAATQDADRVLHIAGVTRARRASTYRAVNTAGILRLAKAASQAGVRRFVFLSSLAARGPDGGSRRSRPPRRVRCTAPRPIPPTLDHQPPPARNLTRRYRSRYFYLFESPIALIQTSMGCLFPCNFCSCQKFTGRRFVPPSPELIADELERPNGEFVMFAGDHSFTDPGRMERLHDLIVRRGIRKRFFVYSRVDCVVQNPELFEAWGRIGLELVMTGLEALDDATLEGFDKKTRAEMNDRALEILRQAGVGVSAGFLVLPDFTEADFRRIDEYVEKRPNILLVEFTPLTPLPGTDLFEVERGRLLTDHRELFDLTHFVVPTRLPQKELYRLMRKYYGREMLRVVRRRRLYRLRHLFRRHCPHLLLGAARDWMQMRRGHEAVHVPVPEDAA